MNPQSEDRVESPEFWDRVVQLFHFALALGLTERVAYLRDAKGTQSGVVAEVESLIREHEQTGSFLDSPAYQAALEAANHARISRTLQVSVEYRTAALASLRPSLESIFTTLRWFVVTLPSSST